MLGASFGIAERGGSALWLSSEFPTGGENRIGWVSVRHQAQGTRPHICLDERTTRGSPSHRASLLLAPLQQDHRVRIQHPHLAIPCYQPTHQQDCTEMHAIKRLHNIARDPVLQVGRSPQIEEKWQAKRATNSYHPKRVVETIAKYLSSKPRWGA